MHKNLHDNQLSTILLKLKNVSRDNITFGTFELLVRKCMKISTTDLMKLKDDYIIYVSCL